MQAIKFSMKILFCMVKILTCLVVRACEHAQTSFAVLCTPRTTKQLPFTDKQKKFGEWCRECFPQGKFDLLFKAGGKVGVE